MKKLKQLTSDEKKSIIESLEICIYVCAVCMCIVFTAFVWICCHHIEEVLEVLASKL